MTGKLSFMLVLAIMVGVYLLWLFTLPPVELCVFTEYMSYSPVSIVERVENCELRFGNG